MKMISCMNDRADRKILNNLELKRAVEDLNINKIIRLLKDTGLNFIIKIYKGDSRCIDLDGTEGYYCPYLYVHGKISILDLTSELSRHRGKETYDIITEKEIKSIFIQIRF